MAKHQAHKGVPTHEVWVPPQRQKHHPKGSATIDYIELVMK